MVVWGFFRGTRKDKFMGVSLHLIKKNENVTLHRRLLGGYLWDEKGQVYGVSLHLIKENGNVTLHRRLLALAIVRGGLSGIPFGQFLSEN